jgi:ankyrin repeat protein
MSVSADVTDNMNNMLLLILGQKPDVTLKDFQDLTALHYAAALTVGRFGINSNALLRIRYAMNSGANTRNLMDDVPFAVSCVKKIIELGADVNARDSHGDTVINSEINLIL